MLRSPAEVKEFRYCSRLRSYVSWVLTRAVIAADEIRCKCCRHNIKSCIHSTCTGWPS